MSSAYPSPDPHRLPDPSSARPTRAPGGVAKLLMYFLFVLALFATVVMFFVDNDVWMNIAVIAALWAAFIGAVLVSRYTGALGEESSRNRERDARRVAEIDAERAEHRRREAELAKSYAERGDVGREETLESIRVELAALRAQLSDLSGLDLTEDQVAVRARAERIIELERHSMEPEADAAWSTGASGNGSDNASPAEESVSPFTPPSTSRSPFQRDPEPSTPAPENHQGGRRGGFVTGTFSAVNWAGADSEETSMIPLVVDTRESGSTEGTEGAAGAADSAGAQGAEEPTGAGSTPEPDPVPSFQAPSFPAATAGHHEAPEPASGHHRRRREETPEVPEDSRGRRRADEHPGGNGSVTVAELMAQLKKNAR